MKNGHMNTNSLEIKICNSPEEAPKYTAPEFKAASLLKAVIVKKGTVQGKATVDLIFEDGDGQKYIAMTTMALLESVTGLS
jgi:hypothetical protein